MRSRQVRTGRLAAAAIVATGVVGALGTAAVLALPTLLPTTEDDARSPGFGTQQTQPTNRQQARDDEGEGEDDEGWTRVTPPRQGARQQSHQSQQSQQSQQSGQITPAPQATSSGS